MLGLGDRPADAAVLARMAQRIAHRGPDDSGLYLDKQVGFGFRRLSILDLSPAGHQPMCSDDGQLVIVFNSEIYNYIELRDELQAAVYRFRSTSDTEVLLAAYRHWGPDAPRGAAARRQLLPPTHRAARFTSQPGGAVR